MLPVYIGILSGVAYGFFYGVSGWKLSGEKFSLRSLLKTVIPTTIIGGLATYANVPYTVFSTGAIGLGITKFVWKIFDNWWES